MEVEWIRNELNSPQLSAAVSMVTLEQHSPVRQLLFRDFCEALVRIAHVKYRHLPSLQKQLEALLQTNILPHATQVGYASCPEQGLIVGSSKLPSRALKRPTTNGQPRRID